MVLRAARQFTFKLSLFIATVLWPISSEAQSFVPGSEALLGWTIKSDCTRGTIQRNTGENSITLCVAEISKEVRRCEVFFEGPDVRRRVLDVRFDVKLNEAAANPSAPIILFQIHSRPDPGEQWRCPMAALRSLPGEAMDLGGVYDQSEVSKPSSNGCTGPGSSIQGYRVFRQEHADMSKWSIIHLRYKLALDSTGEVEGIVNDKTLGRMRGPNSLNDRARPFIKMGLYGEPSSQIGPFCSTIKNLSLKLSD